jgi:UDP-N-acetylmuramyl pentapeptide synthase
LDTSLAAALIGAQTGRMQLAVAARMLKMNSDSAACVAKLIDAAQQNIDRLAKVATGIGDNLDISA